MRQPPGVHGRHEGCHRPAEERLVVAAAGGADAEQVGPGVEGTHGGLADVRAVGDGAHVERVGDHRAGEAELARQRDDPRLERGRARPDRAHHDVRGHEGVEARAPVGVRRQGGGEGGEVAPPQLAQVRRHDGQLQVGVRGGGAVPREVLAAGTDAAAVQPAGERGAVPGHDRRRVPEGAHADHRVGGGVHVEHGRQVEVDAGGREHPAEHLARVAGGPLVVEHSQRRGTRQRRPVGGLQAGDVAALLVDRDEEPGRLLVQPRGERGRRRQVGRVVGEEHDAGEPSARRVLEPGRRPGAGEPREQHAVHGAGHRVERRRRRRGAPDLSGHRRPPRAAAGRRPRAGAGAPTSSRPGRGDLVSSRRGVVVPPVLRLRRLGAG
ncbi:hypothetical protein GCM10009809_40700 [Isoptericola hypogeus]|uniref:Uncharacterized protein n=1 Tax=Isoptericola hypogeus TaxID=300179 RepID=A0ABN2JW42_9MICO